MNSDPKDSLVQTRRRKQGHPGFLAKFLRKDYKKAKLQKRASAEKLKYKENESELQKLIEKNVLARTLHIVRNFFWSLPEKVSKLVVKTRPISYLMIYAILFFALWQGLIILSEGNFGQAFAEGKSEMSNSTYIELSAGKSSQLNPLFISNNPVDRDIQTLVFNKLIRINKEGNAEPELAESWSVSSDSLSYVFFLRKDVYWHDGEKFDADDVVFTFETVKKLGSYDSYTPALEGVEITKIDDYVVKAKLPEINALFMENIAFPIIPEHVLGSVRVDSIETAQFSTAPIGTGPYSLSSFTKEEALLERNEKYFKGEPKIKKIIFKFFETHEQAETFFRLGEGHAISRPRLEDYNAYKDSQTATVYSQPLIKRSRIIYFNMALKNSPLATLEFRQALAAAIDEESLAKQFAGEQGAESFGPIHKESWAYAEDVERFRNNKEQAQKLLDEAGWKLEEGTQFRKKDDKVATIQLTYLESEITNTDEIALQIKSEWEAVGVKVELVPKDYYQLSQETLPTRAYEAMLFEIESTIDPDSYNFWHSNNIPDPGLNISGYDFDRVDILTERARKSLKQSERKEDYKLFQRYLLRDTPAVYLYHPSYFFITHRSVVGPDLSEITIPNERFMNIEEWEIR